MFGRLLLPRSLIGLAIVSLLLLGGQLGQLAPVLRQAGALDWLTLVGAALGVLLEPALPIVCLFASGAAYGAVRADGAWAAALATGHRPLALFRPAIALGLVAALIAAGLAHGPVPRWITAVRGVVVDGLRALPPGTHLAVDGGHVRVAPDGTLHAVVDSTYLRAQGARLQPVGRTWTITLDDAWIWTPRLRARVGTARLQADGSRLARKLGQLGPPNSLPTSALGASAHHRFIAHRRSALPAMAAVWAPLGASLGVALGPLRAVLACAATVAATYWILRTGELNARAGLVPAWFAAWTPFTLTALGLGLVARR